LSFETKDPRCQSSGKPEREKRDGPEISRWMYRIKIDTAVAAAPSVAIQTRKKDFPSFHEN
jgi:hypothetical protein